MTPPEFRRLCEQKIGIVNRPILIFVLNKLQEKNEINIEHLTAEDANKVKEYYVKHKDEIIEANFIFLDLKIQIIKNLLN